MAVIVVLVVQSPKYGPRGYEKRRDIRHIWLILDGKGSNDRKWTEIKDRLLLVNE